MRTDVKQKALKERVEQSDYCVDPLRVATAIIVKLALGEGGRTTAWQSDPSPEAGGGSHSGQAI
jgi:hypothetical protein